MAAPVVVWVGNTGPAVQPVEFRPSTIWSGHQVYVNIPATASSSPIPGGAQYHWGMFRVVVKTSDG